jgi:signal transduction histidine kinase
MCNKTGQPYNHETADDLWALRAENRVLHKENERLSRQAESVAEANAYAAELMAKLEDVNKNLNSEMEKRRLAEEDLRRINNEMEVRVQERTAELTAANEQLLQEIADREKAEQALENMNKDLESAVHELSRSNKELKDFAHIVAHDLKAPLRAIGTLADWIAIDYADMLDQRGKEQIGLLVGRTRRMSNFVDGILRYSEIGRVTQKQQKVNLNTLVAEIIVQIAPPENVEITVENELPVLTCEKTRLIQVFQNLLDNAIKYMDKAQGRIRIACVEEDDFWKFSVADNGPGIAEGYFEKIFEIFQTLSPRDELESTGIGLTVAKKIVETYGGRMWVESKVGEGTTFLFTLPKQEMRAEDAELKANVACQRR